MSAAGVSVREALYEPPGPKMRKKIVLATIISLAALAALVVVIIRQFYITGQLDARYWSFFTRATTWKFLGRGLVGTLEASVVAGIVAFAAGFLLMLGRISSVKAVRGISIALIEFTRGVPTLLLIYFFFLVAPQFGLKLPPLWKIAAPVAISACGVVAEVLRSGVNAVPKGQREAALSLGMRNGKVFFKIVFPQAIRYVVPSLISELVIVVKDTTFAYVVNFPDLMQNARVLITNYDAMLSVYLLIAVIYIIINYLLNKASAMVAKRRNSKTIAQRNEKGVKNNYESTTE
ncbi:MAG: amino acid ABC transporter permease [Lachnospiraceae bacterium]|nr:amino acid ABC transporter permease [Lachnospiraceae bacterium]